MTLQQLRYIIEVANQGSINEAAKKLFITIIHRLTICSLSFNMKYRRHILIL